MSDAPGIDALRGHVRILASLLDDPHPGLFTWRESLCDQIQQIKQFGLSPLDHAAPKLLAACKAGLAELHAEAEREGWGSCFDETNAVIQLRSAIAKAEGTEGQPKCERERE